MVSMILISVISVQYRPVTDGQTDEQTDRRIQGCSIYRDSISLRGNNYTK